MQWRSGRVNIGDGSAATANAGGDNDLPRWLLRYQELCVFGGDAMGNVVRPSDPSGTGGIAANGVVVLVIGQEAIII